MPKPMLTDYILAKAQTVLGKVASVSPFLYVKFTCEFHTVTHHLSATITKLRSHGGIEVREIIPLYTAVLVQNQPVGMPPF